MGKFEGLGQRLRKETLAEVVLTFDEIEAAAGVSLPESARRPQYWENASKPGHMRGPNKAAQEAGYRSYLLAGHDKVRFIRS